MSQHGKKLGTPLVLLIVGAMVVALAVTAVMIRWMPTSASTYSDEVDWLYYFIYYISVFFTLLIAGLLVFFLLFYKQTDKAADAPGKATHSTALELTWTIIPIFIVLAIFAFGFKSYMDMAVAPTGSYKIIANAKQWSWGFTYPNGYSDANLHIFADHPVELTLESSDVIHSLYIKQFRAKKDVVPGRYNTMWFEAPWNEQTYQAQLAAAKAMPEKREGDTELRVTDFTEQFGPVMIFDLYCTEYCGKSHAQMNRQVVVHKTRQQFEDWLAFYSRPENVYANPVAHGRAIWQSQCKTCHSIDGSSLSGGGPTWQNIWMRELPLVGGGTWKDRYDSYEEYIKAAIHVPQQDIVQGYQGVNMSAFPGLGQRDLRSVMEFMKSISEGYEDQAIGSWEAGDDAADEGQGGEDAESGGGAGDDSGGGADETSGQGAAADQASSDAGQAREATQASSPEPQDSGREQP